MKKIILLIGLAVSSFFTGCSDNSPNTPFSVNDVPNTDASVITIGSNTTATFTNAQFYTLGSSNVTVYTTASATTVAGSIYPGDRCNVLDASGTYWKVSYPVSSGLKIAYCSRSAILSNTNYCKKISLDVNTTVYRKSDMSISFGTAMTTDNIFMLTPISNGKTQIIYNVSGGYKIGWIYAADNTPPQTSWRYPMDAVYCTWKSSTNKSWANYNSINSSNRDYHVGIDIYGTDGKVFAVSNGKVVAANGSLGETTANGNFVIIQHTLSNTTVYSFYAHLASVSVSSGATVTAGQQIGVAGSSGTATNAVHLHFAVVDVINSSGGYLGYVPYFTGDKITYGSTTFYNPCYVIAYNKLPA